MLFSCTSGAAPRAQSLARRGRAHRLRDRALARPPDRIGVSRGRLGVVFVDPFPPPPEPRRRRRLALARHARLLIAPREEQKEPENWSGSTHARRACPGNPPPCHGDRFFILAGVAIICAAQPFADALVSGGRAPGLDRISPRAVAALLASEAPEFWSGKILAHCAKPVRRRARRLLLRRLNQWTMLVGQLANARTCSAAATPRRPSTIGSSKSCSDKATQALLGSRGACSDLRLKIWEAALLLALFASQARAFPEPRCASPSARRPAAIHRAGDHPDQVAGA